MIHRSVLTKEIIQYLKAEPNKNFIDATFGQGGHTLAILEKTKPNGKVLAIEYDPILYRSFTPSPGLQKRLILINDSYTNLEKVVKDNNFGPVHGILFDLGVSMWHFKKSRRGFSFQKNEILDMRINPYKEKIPAYKIINEYPEQEIEKILREFGEEKFAKRIAKAIVLQRKEKPILTTLELVEIVERTVPRWYRKQRIHCATRVFQALRIAVNNELENIKKGLEQSLKVLFSGSRIAVISFHSLEDRLVKKFFKEKASNNILKIITKKPIVSSREEIITNPASRSAKLRVAELI